MITRLAARAGAVAVLALAAALAQPAAAQEQAERVAVHTDWSVFTPGNPRECYVASAPTATVARRDNQVVQVNRGDIRLFVSYRPQDNVRGEVSFAAGFPFREGSEVRVTVNGETFRLPAGQNGWAWPASPEEDQRLVAAFRRGSDARVTATSQRGNTTEDTFSLMGFTAALNDAEARCR